MLELPFLDYFVVIQTQRRVFVFVFVIFGCVGSSLLCAGFSLVAASGGYSSSRCTGLSVRWLLFVVEHGL